MALLILVSASIVIVDLSDNVESDMLGNPLKFGFSSPNETKINNIEISKLLFVVILLSLSPS